MELLHYCTKPSIGTPGYIRPFSFWDRNIPGVNTVIGGVLGASQYKDVLSVQGTHFKDKTVSRLFYLRYGNPHSWERRSLYCILASPHYQQPWRWLTTRDKQVLVFHKKGSPLPVLTRCWEIKEKVNMFLCFLKQIRWWINSSAYDGCRWEFDSRQTTSDGINVNVAFAYRKCH